MINRLIFTVFLILPQFVIDVCTSHAGENIENLKAGVVKITSTFGGIKRLGTGIIIKLEGDSAYIITASHVVEGDPTPSITFHTRPNHSYSSRIIGLEVDNPKGLAVVIVEDKISRKLKKLSINHKIPISGGEKGILIGFPRISGTPWMVTPVTLGGQNGRDLTFSGVADEGNSGGPIIIDGKVVGIITHMANQFGNATPALSIIQALEGWGILPQNFKEQNSEESSEVKLIRILEKELLFKNKQIENLLQQFLPNMDPKPSPLARETAKAIPQDSAPYNQALKAIGEENYNKGRNYLDLAIQNHQIELGKAYLAYGRIEETNFQFIKAEEWYNKALQESPKDPDIMERLGHVLIQNLKLIEAETIFLQALSISEKLYGETHSKVIGLKNYLGWVSHGLGKNAQALSLEKEALLGWKVSKGPEHHMVGISFNLIGQIYTSLGEFEKADEAFLKGIEILEKDPSTDRGTLGGFWCLTAVSPLMSQQYEKAIPLLIQGISISAESDFYSDWLCHFFLGFAYGAQHQWNLAEKNTEKALLLAQENMEPNSSTVALTSLTMAAIYFDQKRLLEAQPLAMIGVDILDNRLKPNYYGPPFLLDLLILGNHILGQNDKVAALVKTRIKSHGSTNIFSQMLENLGVKIR